MQPREGQVPVLRKVCAEVCADSAAREASVYQILRPPILCRRKNLQRDERGRESRAGDAVETTGGFIHDAELKAPQLGEGPTC